MYSTSGSLSALSGSSGSGAGAEQAVRRHSARIRAAARRFFGMFVPPCGVSVSLALIQTG